jgi:hypothetical protein
MLEVRRDAQVHERVPLPLLPGDDGRQLHPR